MERLEGLKDACLSGGARGADVEWGRCAAELGHAVIHWSFPGHQSRLPPYDSKPLVLLSDEQLELANNALENTATALGKSMPKRPVVKRLLQRNYYQVAKSAACYAVTVIRDDVVGGTAWATTMFSQLHPESRELYLFDQEKDAWFQWNGESWDQIESPPRPKGLWAGIGSRDLKPNGREAIRKLMGCSFTRDVLAWENMGSDSSGSGPDQRFEAKERLYGLEEATRGS